MPTPTRRMAFYEVGKGSYAQKMQVEFERAQRLALETGQKITVTSKVTLTPPKNKDESFGAVAYSVDVSKPAYKSMEYMTEIDKDGRVLQDGENVVELLQEELDLNPPNTTPMRENEGAK